jgi:glucose/arabinose dehydrogenase
MRLRLAILALAAGACSDDSPASPADDAGGGDLDGGGEDAPLPCTPVSGTPNLTLEFVADGFTNPVDVQAPPGDPRLFVVEQNGFIRILVDGDVLPDPFLDLSGGISTGGERGLLGLAFHPDYANNGLFFVNYTDTVGDTHIAEFRTSDDPDVADPGESPIFFASQPFSNHNGGALAFGPDGYLYLGLGDGGSGCDPDGRGQSLTSPLGKILRLDVDSASPYAIPPTNPFVGIGSALGEIWAYGLRNPWRISFDRQTGDLYIADVGQNEWEEIDVQPAASAGGENYGWRDWEADVCQDGAGTSCSGAASCDPTGITFPAHAYPHGPTINCFGEGASVTGGHVYRGCRMPGVRGTYFYADYCFGTVHSLEWTAGAAPNLRDWPSLDATVATFGQDAAGELLLADYATGTIWRIVPE